MRRSRVQSAYRQAASSVSFVLRPASFSSRLMRVAAAETPMKSAKRGSRLREMRWAGADILEDSSITGAGFEGGGR